MADDTQNLADGDGVSVHSGFPNPAADRRGRDAWLALDLNQLLVHQTASTYLFRVAGHHWADQGIYDGDVAIIDRALQARPTDLIISWQAGGQALRRQHQLTGEDRPWGVVTAIIHQYR